MLGFHLRIAVACLLCGLFGAGETIGADGTGDGFCGRIANTIVQARVNFPPTDQESAAFPSLPGTHLCDLHDQGGGLRVFRCTWHFSYRDPAAEKLLLTLDSLLQDCLGPEAERLVGRPVNHPDSYDQRRFLLEGPTVSVSLKDKAASQNSFVFLAITGKPPG